MPRSRHAPRSGRHHRDHSNHLAIVVLGAEVGGALAHVIGEADLLGTLMRPQHGLAEAKDFVGPTGLY
jgi:hypothetical protein